MSVKDSTFSELKDLTFALIGREYTDSSNQYKRIVSLFNQGARRAYRASNYWERFLVVAEPRTVTSGLVESTEDAYYVRGAGTSEANGLYTRDGTILHPKYSKFDSDGTTVLFDIRNNGSAASIGANGTGSTSDVHYEGTSSGSDILETGWSVSSTGSADAKAPAPLVIDLANIDTFLRIYKHEPFNRSHAQECDFYVKGGRAYVLGSSAQASQVFVTYKKEYTPNYTSASAGSDTVPAEFLPYMAHYAAYTWQRSVEQNASENNFALSLSIVNQVLEDELAKLEAQGIYSTNVARKFKTYKNT